MSSPVDDGAPPAPAPPAPRRPVRVALLAVIPVGIVLVLLIAVLGTRKAAVDRTISSSVVGKPAPAVVGRTIDGRTFDLGKEKTWVVVNFFASWCVPCRVEHPELRAFQQEHAAKGDVSLVSVVYGDQVDDVKRFFRQNGGDWPVVLDEAGGISVDYGVSGVPETYLVSPQGTVVYKIISGVTRAGLDKLINGAEKAAR